MQNKKVIYFSFILLVIFGFTSKASAMLTVSNTGFVGDGAFNTLTFPGIATGSTKCLHIDSSGVISGTGSDCGSALSPLTTKGDLFTFDTAGQRLPVGTNGQVLSSDSTQATGLKWITLIGGGNMTTGTYDPAGIGQQILGTTAIQIVTNKNLTDATNTFPIFNQNTTGSSAKWTTARTLAGNSVDGSVNVPFSNKFIVQGTTDAGLTGGQFLGSLGTGILKNTTGTGVLSIAAAGTDYQAPIALTTIGTSGPSTFTPGTGALNIPQYTAGTGTVSTLSVASTNGFAGTVATPTTTPVITLSTSITGILKGNGTAMSAAVAGDFPALNQNTTGYSSALKSATTTVDVSAATAPTIGQVLTATSPTTATWQSQSPKRTCSMVIGADNGSADLAALDIGPQRRQCFVPMNATVTEITISANAGTPAVTVGRNRAGVVTNISPSITTGAAGALACANAAGSGFGIDGVTTCNVALNSTNSLLVAGDWIELVTGTPSTGATRLSVSVTYIIN